MLRKADGLALNDFLSDEDLRFGVERNFIHIGEVVSQVRREFPISLAKITDVGRIADFRNFIIHRYWDVDHRAMWITLTTKVGPLLSEVEAILRTLP